MMLTLSIEEGIVAERERVVKYANGEANLNWLLVVLIFDTQGGSMTMKAVKHKAYPTQEACDAAGRSFRGIINVPTESKSLSICVTRDWFNAKGWQSEDFE